MQRASAVCGLRRLWQALRLVAAVAVVLTVVADSAAPLRCHQDPQVRATPTVAADASPGDDRQCVPDCFSCSTLVASQGTPSLDPLARTVEVASLGEFRFSPGVYRLPYRPPLTPSQS